MPLATGSIVDERYRIVRRAGGGGFGEVFEAQQLPLETTVALKTLRLPSDISAEARADRVLLLLEEARHLSRLRHPNIVSALDAGVIYTAGEATPYLVLEWCAGNTVARHLVSSSVGDRSMAVAWELLQPIVLAIAHAHDAGVVHRDLKPSNIMLEEHGGQLVPRVIDFGIAKMFSAESGAGSGLTRTSARTSPHTPTYAAPEQVVGARTGPWTDVHGLGLLFVELLIGRRAYGSDVAADAVAPGRPSPARWGVDVGAFEPVLQRALSLRPRDRHPHARALFEALASAAETMGLPHAALPPVIITGTCADAPSTQPEIETEGDAAPPSHTIASSRTPLAAPPGEGMLLADPSSGVRANGLFDTPVSAARPNAALETRDRSRRRRVLLAAAGAAVLGLAAVGWRIAIDGAPPQREIHHLAELNSDDVDERLRRVLGTAEPTSWNESQLANGHRLVVVWANGRVLVTALATDNDGSARFTDALDDELASDRERGMTVVYALEGETGVSVSASDAGVASRLLDELIRGTDAARAGE